MASTPRLHDMSTPLRITLGALIGVGVGLFLLLARPTGLFESLELRFIDVRTQHFLGQRAPDPRIVLAEIQEDDINRLKKLGPDFDWPWSLDINAEAFRLMAEAGVLAVAVDMLQLDQGAYYDDFGRAIPTEEKGADWYHYQHQLELALLLRDAYRGVPTSLGLELYSAPTDLETPVRVAAVEGKLGEAYVGGATGLLQRRGANLPVSRLAHGAKNLGFVNVPNDSDGIVRRAFAVGAWGERKVPSLPLATVALVSGGDVAFEDGGIRVGEAHQPLSEDGSFLVNFRGFAAHAYPRVAPADMLRWVMELDETGALPAEAKKALEGKIVLWGLNIAGQKDVVASPISGTLHGPEYHATTIDNLLHGDGRVLATPLLNALILFLLAIGLGAAEGAIRARTAPHLVPLLLALILVVVAYWLHGRGLAIDLFTPVMAIVLTWGVTSIVRVMTEGRRRRWLEGTFGRYLAPSIIEALKDDPDLVELGGRRREISILFSDVEGFTRLSEALTPENVVSLLNRYLTVHCAAVMENGGVVDKFEGDAVMAFFGDPVPTDHHAVDACRTAVSVFERLPELEPVWRGMGLEGFSIRVGVNTGTAVVGNMGSDQRFDYTCMGDAVNLASRLEGANKAFDSGIMIGGQTYESAKDDIVAKPLAGLVVVGRKTPEPVYQLLAMRDEAPEDLLRHVEAYTRAHGLLEDGDLGGAREALVEAERLRPGDGPTAWLTGIVEQVAGGGIDRPWSGIVELTGK